MEVIDARAMQSSRIYINSNFSEITCIWAQYVRQSY